MTLITEGFIKNPYTQPELVERLADQSRNYNPAHALCFYKKVLELRENTLHKNDPNLAPILYKIGMQSLKIENGSNKGLLYLKRALKIYVLHFENTPETIQGAAATLKGISICYFLKGNTEMCLYYSTLSEQLKSSTIDLDRDNHRGRTIFRRSMWSN